MNLKSTMLYSENYKIKDKYSQMKNFQAIKAVLLMTGMTKVKKSPLSKTIGKKLNGTDHLASTAWAKTTNFLTRALNLTTSNKEA